MDHSLGRELQLHGDCNPNEARPFRTPLVSAPIGGHVHVSQCRNSGKRVQPERLWVRSGSTRGIARTLPLD